MAHAHCFIFTPAELKTLVQNLSEAAQRWHIISQESPFPEAVEAAKQEWVRLCDLLDKIDPALGV
jgi:hypothetical protein